MGLIYYSTYLPVIHPIATLLDIRSTRLLGPYLTHTRLYYIHFVVYYLHHVPLRQVLVDYPTQLKLFSSPREHLSKSSTSSRVRRVRLNNGAEPIGPIWMGEWTGPSQLSAFKQKQKSRWHLCVSEDWIGCGASTSFIVTQLFRDRLRSPVPRAPFSSSL